MKITVSGAEKAVPYYSAFLSQIFRPCLMTGHVWE